MYLERREMCLDRVLSFSLRSNLGELIDRQCRTRLCQLTRHRSLVTNASGSYLAYVEMIQLAEAWLCQPCSSR